LVRKSCGNATIASPRGAEHNLVNRAELRPRTAEKMDEGNNDLLELDGECVDLVTRPPLPEKHPRIRGGGSPTGPRGYVASWKVKNEHLYLVELRGKYQLIGEEPLFADWVTTDLKIEHGQQSVAPGRGWGFQEELFVRVDRGMVVRENDVTWLEAVPSRRLI
jgi:hypothetical protein